MPFVKVNIHFVWSTKNRTPYLNTSEVRKTVWQHIKENGKKKGIFIDTVNGYQEHCHCLISLGIDKTISNTMQLIKGESSFWINRNKLSPNKFEWQEEYYGVAVSEADLPAVRQYILNQEEHHKHQTFQQEFDNFLQKGEFQKHKDGSIWIPNKSLG